jgi:putative flippase GtrA
MSASPPDPGRPAGSSSSQRRDRVERTADWLIPRRLGRYSEQILYLLVGGWNTLFGYLTFVVLYYLLHGRLSVMLILVASYAFSVANAYVCYRYVVFRSRGSVLREMPRFTSVYLVALGANLVIMPLALHWLPLGAYAIQAIFTMAVVVLSYFGHKHFSFRGARGGDPEGQGNGAERQSTPRGSAAGRE